METLKPQNTHPLAEVHYQEAFVRPVVVRRLVVRPLVVRPQGPVVRTPVSANPGLNFNPGFFFFLSKALYRIMFSILFRVSNHEIVRNLAEFDF